MNYSKTEIKEYHEKRWGGIDLYLIFLCDTLANAPKPYESLK